MCLCRENKGGKTGKRNIVLYSVSGVWDKQKIRHKSQISSSADLVQPSTYSTGEKEENERKNRDNAQLTKRGT